MKISVVTAVYNRASTIGRAIDSFNSQSWADREQIVIDGASTDNTLDAVKARATKRSIVYSAPDYGIYDAINKGLSKATGEVIGLLHSDDLFADDTVLAQVASIFEDPLVDIAYANADFFHKEQPGRIVRRYNSEKFKPEALARGWMPAHTTMFVRRSIFDRFGYYSLDYQIAADFEFIARVFRQADIIFRFVPEVWVKMQTGGKSTAGLKSKITLNREVLRACRENGIDTSYAKLLSKYPTKLLELLRF